MNYQPVLLTSLLIAVFAAGVTACEQVPNTTIARSVEDGARVEKSWVRTWRDRARFECVASSSGACQVVVFVTECPGPAIVNQKGAILARAQQIVSGVRPPDPGDDDMTPEDLKNLNVALELALL